MVPLLIPAIHGGKSLKTDPLVYSAWLFYNQTMQTIFEKFGRSFNQNVPGGLFLVILAPWIADILKVSLKCKSSSCIFAF